MVTYMQRDYLLNRQIKPFNFVLIWPETNHIIPCLHYSKGISDIQYKPFIDYKTGNNLMYLPLPSTAYWKSLEDILKQYVMHNDNKFDYDKEGKCKQKTGLR